MAQHQQAAAALLHQHPDPYAFAAAAPAYHAFLHSPPAPFYGYGSQPQYASLPPRVPLAGRPNSSIAFGGQGSSLGSGLPPLPRPATSGAVYRSTSEWGQLTVAQKEAAQVGLRTVVGWGISASCVWQHGVRCTLLCACDCAV